MSQIERKIILPDPTKGDKFQEDLIEALNRYTQKVGDCINKGIRAADNWDAQIISVVLAAANVEQAVAHTLKRVPIGYIVVSNDKAAIIYDGTTAWTSTNLYIRSNVITTTVKIILL